METKMKISLIRGMLLTCLLTLVMVVSSTVADAAIHYTANGGESFTLDYNHQSQKGKYIVITSGGNEDFTFDYNPNTKEFTMYENGKLFAVRKFRGRDSVINKSFSCRTADGVYDKGRDGHYYHEIMGDWIWESTAKAFLLFLDAGGNLGDNKPIHFEINRDIKATVRQGVADVPVLLMNNSNRRYYFEYVDFTLILQDNNGNTIGTFTKRENLNGNLNAHSTVKRNIHFEDSRIPNHSGKSYKLNWTWHGKWN